MKSLKIVAALAVAVATWSATAEDSYLYWMVDKDATYNATAGGTLNGTQVNYDYAKVSLDDGVSYLSLYSANTGASIGTDELYKGNNGVAGFVASPDYKSFLIELYSFSSNERVGWTTLSYSAAMADYVYDNPMRSQPMVFMVSSVTPEPTSGLLLLLGLSSLALKRKKAVA